MNNYSRHHDLPFRHSMVSRQGKLGSNNFFTRKLHLSALRVYFLDSSTWYSLFLFTIAFVLVFTSFQDASNPLHGMDTIKYQSPTSVDLTVPSFPQEHPLSSPTVSTHQSSSLETYQIPHETEVNKPIPDRSTQVPDNPNSPPHGSSQDSTQTSHPEKIPAALEEEAVTTTNVSQVNPALLIETRGETSSQEKAPQSINDFLIEKKSENILSLNVPTRKGLSLVAACKNRQERLPQVLPNWSAVIGLDEILLVDWASQPPLKDYLSSAAGHDIKIRYVRVEGEESWILSRAYNLGMKLAAYDKVLRVDCDHMVDKNFLERHSELGKVNPATGKGIFYSGNWQAARSENEVHLNGALFITKEDFWKVAGYDERIQTYGWDDEDLYQRLTKNGFERKQISYDAVSHIPHGDSMRGQQGVKFADVEVDFNRLLLEKLPSWDSSRKELSFYNFTENEGNLVIHATKEPLSIDKLSSSSQKKYAWEMALGRRLHDEYDVPWDMMMKMKVETKEFFLRTLMAGDLNDQKKPKILFAHVMHGLGNRLRALGSALSFATETNRTLVIIWESDKHCQTLFSDLFTDNFTVIDNFFPKWPFTDASKYDKAWLKLDAYNYMEMEGRGAEKGALINNNPDNHIYYKGAYIMEAPKYSSWEKDNALLRNLHPNQNILDKVNAIPELENMIGVHIRNKLLKDEIEKVDSVMEYGEQATEIMNYWRKKSNLRNFAAKIDEYLAQNPDQSFYVSSDTKSILEELKQKYPGKIHSTSRDCDTRNSECLQYALIDLIALSRTKILLGSNWSSFTEVAERLGKKKALLVGKDFAVDDSDGIMKPEALKQLEENKGKNKDSTGSGSYSTKKKKKRFRKIS